MSLRTRLWAALMLAMGVPAAIAVALVAGSVVRAFYGLAVAGVVGFVISMLLSENLTRPIQHELSRSRADVQASVHRLGEALRSTHDLGKILAVVLETAMVAVKGRSGAVYMLSANRQELYVKVGRHLPKDAAARRIPLGAGLAGAVVADRQPVLLPGAPDAPTTTDPEPSVATAIAVPLETQSQLLGVLVIYGSADDRTFTDADLDTIRSLADQAGVGVENVLLHQEAKRLSITDGLTGIWTHRYFQLQLSHDFERAVRFHHPMSLLFIDIDHFKQINDRYGHQRGNAVLIELAQRVHAHVRMNVDTFARYGGEEFTLILPETPLAGARVVAEKIRTEVAARPFGEGDEEQIPVTVSIGYASYPDHGLTPTVLLNAADQAMYAAKAHGRDRVVGAADLTADPTLAPQVGRS